MTPNETRIKELKVRRKDISNRLAALWEQELRIGQFPDDVGFQRLRDEVFELTVERERLMWEHAVRVSFRRANVADPSKTAVDTAVVLMQDQYLMREEDDKSHFWPTEQLVEVALLLTGDWQQPECSGQ